MVDIPENESSASGRLHTAQVFEFSQARSVIVANLGQPEGSERQRGFEMLQLTSAEFALLPVYLMPQTLTLPLSEPLSVPGWAALASLIKGGCSLAKPYHYDVTNLITFIGDAQKLQNIPRSLGLFTGAEREPDWNSLNQELRDQYRRAETAIGVALAERGVIQLQTLLLAAKWMTAVPGADVNLPELARSLGVIAAG